MKFITIDDRNKATVDTISELCQINLIKDIVICYPFSEESEPDINFEVDEFTLYNRNQLQPNVNGLYTFFPRIKIMVPDGLRITEYCKFPGISIISKNIDKYKGIQLNTKLALSNLDIELFAEIGKYNIYHKLEYIISEFNRELFLKGMKNRGVGMRIPPNSPLLGLYFVQTFQGGISETFNEIYIIRSNYLYKTFPNFGSSNEID